MESSAVQNPADASSHEKIVPFDEVAASEREAKLWEAYQYERELQKAGLPPSGDDIESEGEGKGVGWLQTLLSRLCRWQMGGGDRRAAEWRRYRMWREELDRNRVGRYEGGVFFFFF